MEVARIEAEARARLEADNAQRAHELEMLRVRGASGGRRLSQLLGAALALVVCTASVGSYAVTRHIDGLEVEAERLRERQLALVREREQALQSELSGLDRRLAALASHPMVVRTADARTAAETARASVDVRSPDAESVRSFRDALDALEGRLRAFERLAQLDARRADLVAWSAKQGRGELPASLDAAAARARGGDLAAITSYEGELDRARKALSSTGPVAARPPVNHPPTTTSCRNEPGNPLCGLDGQPLLR